MLKNKISFIAIVIIFSFTTMLALISISNLRTFQEDILKTSQESVIKSLKEELKDYVEIIAQTIENLLKLYPTDPKKITKKASDELFLNYIIPLYEKYKNNPQIKEIILNIINNYKFNSSICSDSKYFFVVFDLNTKKIVAHCKHKCIGKSIDEVPHPIKKKLLLSLPKTYQVFFKSKWKNGTKYIFAKYFKPFNWAIITVVDEKSIEKTKEKVYSIVKDIRFDNQNYFFGYEKVGEKFYYVFHPFLKGELHLDTKDITGKLYKKEMVEKGMNGGGYITYYFKNLATSKIEKKLTYAKYYPNLNLLIATGTYTTYINHILNPMKKELDEYLIEGILKVTIISFIILIVSFIGFYMLVSHFLTTPINKINEAIHSIEKDYEVEEDLENIIESFAIFTQKIDTQLKNIIKNLKGI